MDVLRRDTIRCVTSLAVFLFITLIATNEPSAFPAIDAAMLERAEQNAASTLKAIETSLKRDPKFRELYSAHFNLRFDCTEREARGLMSLLERTYADLSKQFSAKADDPVFVGKLLVVVISDRTEFEKLVADFEEFTPPRELIGLYRGRDDGGGYLFVCLPQTGPTTAPADARLALSAMAARELSLAFLSRFKGVGELPPWLGRGIACLMQQQLVPEIRVDNSAAKMLASANFELDYLFEPEVPENRQFDAAAASMVKMLADRDKAALGRMIESLKRGVKQEDALGREFALDQNELIKEWRKYLQTRP